PGPAHRHPEAVRLSWRPRGRSHGAMSPAAGVTSAHHARRSMPAANVRTLPSPMQAFMAVWPVAGRHGLQPPAAFGRTWKRPSRASLALLGPTALGSITDGADFVPGS